MNRLCMLALLLSTSWLYGQSEILDSILHQGIYRSFIVHLPPAYSVNTSYPMVMMLHGGGNANGAEMIPRYHFDEVGDTAQYISVFPNGLFNDWADGRGVTDSEQAGTDDVAFLHDLVDSLGAAYSIDRQRVYLTGGSNGGMMTQRMACQRPDQFAAFACMIASLPDSVAISCSPAQPISMLLMNGTEDNLVPYTGGPLGAITDGGTVIGTDSTIRFWQQHNQCMGGQIDSMSFPDVDMNDNSTVQYFHYGYCLDSAELVLYKIDGGGHTLPGMVANTNPLPLVGYVNRDINAAVEIWAFFKKHRRTENATSIQMEAIRPFRIFPNPGNGIFHFQTESRDLIQSISAYNQLGQKTSMLWQEDKLVFENPNEGMYLIRIQTKSSIYWEKILIHY